jgi:hypothetical protein
MSDPHDENEPTEIYTIELPVDLIAELERLRAEFGDELIAEIFERSAAAIKGRLALRGAYVNKDKK